MSEPTMKMVGYLQGRVGRMRSRAGLLALTLGVSATLVASPAVKREIAAAGHTAAAAGASSQSGKPSIRHRWFQIGKASWYGGKFNGRKTASGETYDMYGLTCAHRTLPLGSWVRVTNLINKKWAFVRVNDRGPMVASHIVDLSYGAAQRLGVEGLAKVKIEPVNPGDTKQAEALVAQLSLSDDPVHVAAMTGDPELGLLPAARQ
jgi:rare lipoprotein A